MSNEPTDISTDQAYVQEMFHNSAMFATLHVNLQKELNKKIALNGILMGALLSLLLFSSWAAYEVTERISVNEIRLNQLEAKVETYDR